jgi:hypothetical protein
MDSQNWQVAENEAFYLYKSEIQRHKHALLER